jgi:hypothetical protein
VGVGDSWAVGAGANPPSDWASGYGKDELTRISHSYDVTSSALSPLVGVLSPALPASSVASDAAITVCVVPEEDCAAFAVRTTNDAEHEILIGADRLTTGSGFVEALVRAKKRGVDGRLIADETTPASATAVSSSSTRRERTTWKPRSGPSCWYFAATTS